MELRAAHANFLLTSLPVDAPLEIAQNLLKIVRTAGLLGDRFDRLVCIAGRFSAKEAQAIRVSNRSVESAALAALVTSDQNQIAKWSAKERRVRVLEAFLYNPQVPLEDYSALRFRTAHSHFSPSRLTQVSLAELDASTVANFEVDFALAPNSVSSRELLDTDDLDMGRRVMSRIQETRFKALSLLLAHAIRTGEGLAKIDD